MEQTLKRQSQEPSGIRLLIGALCDPVGAAIAQGSSARRYARAIFVGPSLYGKKMVKRRNELWLSPARAGDILAVVDSFAPAQIVLLDGIFYQDLAVWHKELLYALLKGIVVIGAASMGALRAAELYRYGMLGIGQVYERYLAGEEDDSLVAMTFDPLTYKPLSDARIGQEVKAADALAAIEFARTYTGGVQTLLEADEYLERILERIK